MILLLLLVNGEPERERESEGTEGYHTHSHTHTLTWTHIPNLLPRGASLVPGRLLHLLRQLDSCPEENVRGPREGALGFNISLQQKQPTILTPSSDPRPESHTSDWRRRRRRNVFFFYRSWFKPGSRRTGVSLAHHSWPRRDSNLWSFNHYCCQSSSYQWFTNLQNLIF